MRLLVLLLSLTAACDASTPLEPDASPDGAIDAATDASSLSRSTQRRSERECEPLGSVESVEVPPFHLTTDFFAGCPHRTEVPLPDRAFTWTAPSTGLYVFELTSNDDFAPPVSLELRHGDCPLTESEGEGGYILPIEPLCAGDYYVEEGRSPPYQVLRVEENETITLVVEGAEYLDPGEDWMERHSIGLSVSPAQCPSAPVLEPDPPAITHVEELPAHAPVYFEIFSTSDKGRRLRELSCVETFNPRQYGVAWTAPEAGRYTFETEAVGLGANEPVGIAVLQESCDGGELACDSDERRAAVSLALDAGQRIILMVEVDVFHDEDPPIALRVRSETAVPEHAECEALAEGATLTAAAFRTSNHFFPNCDNDLDLPDKAFTWRAPASGLYAFSLTNDAIFGGAESDLMLLRGDCVLPTKGEPICADRHVRASYGDEDFISFHEVISVEEGEVITIVVNGDDAYPRPGIATNESLRQTLTLRVEPAQLPDTETAGP